MRKKTHDAFIKIASCGLLLAGIFTLNGCKAQVTNNAKPNPMTNETALIQKKAEELLHLPDNKYYTVDQNGLQDLQRQLAKEYNSPPGQPFNAERLASNPKVLAIGAPKVLNKSGSPEIPLLVATMYSGQRQWETEFRQNFWVIARHIATNEVLLSRPFVWDKRVQVPKPSKTGNAPAASMAGATTTLVQRIQMHEIYPHTKWYEGTYHITAIDYNWVSNTIPTEVTGGEGKKSISPDSVEAKVEAFEAVKLKAEPLLSESPQLLFNSTKGALACNFSAVLPVSNATIALDNKQSTMVFTLLMVQLDNHRPVKINLAAPVSTIIKETGDPKFEANFAFDVTRAAREQPIKGTYMAYLISGALITGPVEVKVD